MVSIIVDKLSSTPPYNGIDQDASLLLGDLDGDGRADVLLIDIDREGDKFTITGSFPRDWTLPPMDGSINGEDNGSSQSRH